MRLILLTFIVLIAFAANSVLNRAALLDPLIDPVTFAWIRTLSGAVALVFLIALRDRTLTQWGTIRASGALALAFYMICFSIAYVSIDTGVGALILFGGAQVTMFAGALIAGEDVPRLRWMGAALALVGLAWLLWPTDAFDVSLIHAGLMLGAAFGWGIYSLVGRKAKDPLRATAINFVLAAPICIAVALVLPTPSDATETRMAGVVLALVSGVGTSALAYALWYVVLPQLSASVAGIAMVTVPVIASTGGVLFLGEEVTLRFVLASALVLGGVAIGVLAPQRTSSSSGS